MFRLLFFLVIFTLCNAGGEESPDKKVTTFEEGYKYNYFFQAETEIMGMDNLTTEIEVCMLMLYFISYSGCPEKSSI